MKYSFCNDYSELAHSRILETLIKYQDEQNIGYGEDIHTANAVKLIKEKFNCLDADVHFLTGGTQTNMTLISYALRPYEAVLACESGHINVHETGAVEATGHKIITEVGKNGKLYPSDVIHALEINNGCHMAKIKMVYISNSTEIGTIYTKDELIALYKVCKENDLYLFMDGARLSSALGSRDNDLEPSDIPSLCDAFYIGGTKIGFLNGEGLVLVNEELKKDFRYHIKNRGAMNAKGFVLGIEFEEMFKDNLYFELGKFENLSAYYLAGELLDLGVEFASKTETNQIFINLDNEVIEKLKEDYLFEMWNYGEKTSTIRLVTSFKTPIEMIDEFINDLKAILK